METKGGKKRVLENKTGTLFGRRQTKGCQHLQLVKKFLMGAEKKNSFQTFILSRGRDFQILSLTDAT